VNSERCKSIGPDQWNACLEVLARPIDTLDAVQRPAAHVFEYYGRVMNGGMLLHIEFSEQDGMGVAPEMICFNFRSMHWRERLPALRVVAAEFGFRPVQDEVVQGSHTLTYALSADTARTAAATVTLLSRGCGLADETEITYSAGALDER